MSTLKIKKRQMNTTFNYEGDEYVISGSSTSDLGGQVTNITMRITDFDGMDVGSANAYISSMSKKPKINLNDVDTDLLIDVVTEVKDCIAKIKADIAAYDNANANAVDTEK